MTPPQATNGAVGTTADALDRLTDHPAGQALAVLLILLAAHLAAVILRRTLGMLLKSRVARSPKFRTLSQFIVSIAVFVLYFAALGIALRVIGVSLTAYIASATVIGFAVSFGSQGVVQDVISGLTLITSDLLDVGDMVDIGGQTGIVRTIGIRYTQLTTLTGSRVYIPNRNVTNVINYELGYSRVFLDARLPADEEKARAARQTAAALAAEAAEQFRGVMPRDPVLSEPQSPGAQSIRIEFRVWPGQNAIVESTIRQRITAAMREIDESYADWMVAVHYRTR